MTHQHRNYYINKSIGNKQPMEKAMDWTFNACSHISKGWEWVIMNDDLQLVRERKCWRFSTRLRLGLRQHNLVVSSWPKECVQVRTISSRLTRTLSRNSGYDMYYTTTVLPILGRLG